jgi:hypothetical protein
VLCLLRRITCTVTGGSANRANAVKNTAASSGAFVGLDVLRVEFEIGDVDGF